MPADEAQVRKDSKRAILMPGYYSHLCFHPEIKNAFFLKFGA